MTSPEAIYVVRWLVRDTFRQALASRVFWLMLGISGLCILFCLGVGVDGGLSPRAADDTELYDATGQPLTGPNPNPGHLTLAFGMVRCALFRDAEAEVHFLQAVLAKWVAGAAGLLLALVWTAGFLPDTLQPQTAAVLLAKPVPRWCLLTGKYLGVVAFVGFQAAVFFGGTWLALGMRTGVWPPTYLLGAVVAVLHFAVIYSFSVLLAVWTRSTVACAFGGVLFWLVCLGMNYGRHAVIALPPSAAGTASRASAFGPLAEAGYWVLPKPADLMVLLDQALEADRHFATPPELAAALRSGHLQPGLSLLTSLLFAVVVLMVAARHLTLTEY